LQWKTYKQCNYFVFLIIFATITALKRGVDVDERYATIWGDQEYSDLDLMRHLMAYIYMIGWKGGFLFPSAKELANPPTDGVYKTCISADELRSWSY
jgi:hypothetical protein